MDKPLDREIRLDREVKALLEVRRGEWLHISKEADISHSWLSKFVRDEIPNPGYATLKRIHAFLTQNVSARSGNN